MFEQLRLKRTVAPASLPIHLTETKEACDITGTGQDSLIELLMYSAVDALDGYKTGSLGRAIVTQTWEIKLDDFGASVIMLPLPPLQSVVSITYIAPGGGTETLPSAYYEVDTHSEPGRIVLADGYSWPTVKDTTNAVTITFICGYGAVEFTDGYPTTRAATVPESLRNAMMLRVRSLYEERFGDKQVFDTYMRAYERCIAPFRVIY